jgi:hypothetical protein
MNYENFKPGFNKPTIITGQQYGIKVSVELDHSDTDIHELFDAFETICVGLGYHADSWKNWVLERASEYQEEEDDKWDLNDEFADVRHQYENREQLENDFFGEYDESDKRMDIIGQNGNEGLHYRATQEDEAEFDDYGARIVTDSSFEWGDEPEEDNLFEGDEWFANDNLKEGKEKYDKALKALTKKQKQNDNKTKKRNTKG